MSLLTFFISNYGLFTDFFYLRPSHMYFGWCWGKFCVFEIFENVILNIFQFWLQFVFWTFLIWGLLLWVFEFLKFCFVGVFGVIFELLNFLKMPFLIFFNFNLSVFSDFYSFSASFWVVTDRQTNGQTFLTIWLVLFGLLEGRYRNPFVIIVV